MDKFKVFMALFVVGCLIMSMVAWFKSDQQLATWWLILAVFNKLPWHLKKDPE